MQLNGQNIDQFLSIVTCKPQNGTVFVLYNTMFLNTVIRYMVHILYQIKLIAVILQ